MRFGPTLWLLAVVSTAPLQGQVDSAVAVSEEQKQIELTAIAESALWQGDPALVQRLIAAGWNVNAEGGRSGDKLFYQFIQKGSHKIVAAMVAAGARLNDVDEQGRTPLSVAAGGLSDNPSEESSLQMVKYLIEQGADIHAGGEAAVAAASGNNLSLVKFLVAMGGKPAPMALATAVGAWKRDVVDYLLQSGVDPKARLEDGRSLLHMLPDKELFVKLLALGLDPNAADNQGQRPVHVAASWGNLKMGEMKLLLEHGADVNAADVEGTTPLMLSTPCRWNDRPTMLEYLLDKGAKLDQRDKQGRTVMDRAWEDGAWEDVLLLKERGLGIANARGRLESFLKNSLTTPVEASAAGKIVAWLLPQAGSLADFKPDGKPLTVWFVLMGQNDLWTMCLKQAVPVDAADAEGRTALMWAEMTGAKQAKSLLLASGARRDLKDGRGKTAANWAAWHDQLERNRKIGESDGSPLSQSHDSRTALEAKRDAFFAAVVQGRAEDVRRQLSANPELMKQLQGGLPPLHVAAGFGKLTVMDELVRRGAPLNEMAANGEVPVVLAVRGGQEEAVAWLLKKAPGVVYVEMSPLAGAAAVAARQNDVLRQLVRDGWRPATGEPSLKALQVAVESNDATLFQMLVKGGAELRPVVLKTPSGKDPFKDLLRALCTVNDVSFLTVFFKHLEKPVRDSYAGLIALIFQSRAKEGDLAGMKICLDVGGVDLNVRLGLVDAFLPIDLAKKEERGFTTALSAAVAAGQTGSVRFLIERGAKLEGVSDSGVPMLHSAVHSGEGALVDLLLLRGVSLQALDGEGRTALQLAEELARTELAARLRKAAEHPSRSR